MSLVSNEWRTRHDKVIQVLDGVRKVGDVRRRALSQGFSDLMFADTKGPLPISDKLPDHTVALAATPRNMLGEKHLRWVLFSHQRQHSSV